VEDTCRTGIWANEDCGRINPVSFKGTEKIRDNRLALLYLIKGIFDSSGDFSKITE